MEQVRDSEKTLRWIVGILQKHNIPFQITGGLAGKAFGNPRPLNDIDIDVPEDRIAEIISDVKEYIVFGPERYRDNDWDLLLLTLNHEGQDIDLGGFETTKIFDVATRDWRLVPCNIDNAVSLEVMGITLPAVDPKDYIAYKQSLHRIVKGVAIDQEDARYAQEFLNLAR